MVATFDTERDESDDLPETLVETLGEILVGEILVEELRANSERNSLLSSAVRDVPFQLLPHVVHPPEILESLLKWQGQFTEALGGELMLSVVYIQDSSDDSVNDQVDDPVGDTVDEPVDEPVSLSRLFASLQVQSSAGWELLIATRGKGDDMVAAGEGADEGKDCHRLELDLCQRAGDVRIYTFSESASRAEQLALLVENAKGRYVMVAYAGMLLHPSAVYALTKASFLSEPFLQDDDARLPGDSFSGASFIVPNELVLDMKCHVPLGFFRKSRVGDWSHLLAHYWGTGVFVRQDVLEESLQALEIESVDAGLVWQLCLYAISHRMTVQYLQLGVVAFAAASALPQMLIGSERQVPLAAIRRAAERLAFPVSEFSVVKKLLPMTMEGSASSAAPQIAVLPKFTSRVADSVVDGETFCSGGAGNTLGKCKAARSSANRIPEDRIPEDRIQVLIPFRDCPELTVQCLRSLSEQDCLDDLAITLIDNGSTETSLQVIREAAHQMPGTVGLRIIRQDGYFNYAQLNNSGLEGETSEYLLFLNNDVELDDPQAISSLRQWAAMGAVGLVGGLLFYPDRTVQSSGIVFPSIGPANVKENGQYCYTTREVPAVSLACALIRRRVFEDVGRLDEFYCPNGFGDALLGKRVAALGYKVILCAEATAVHHESKSRGASIEEIERWELLANGLHIPTLYDDFEAVLQPMMVDLRPRRVAPFEEVVNAISRRPRVYKWCNLLAKLLLKQRFWRNGRIS